MVLTSNYGEAGAVDRFGSAYGLPPAFSRHNAFWYWGPPPMSATVVIAVGFTGAELGFCGSAQPIATRLRLAAGKALRERAVPVHEEAAQAIRLYLTCAKFVTTPQYAPRFRERLCLERQLADDAEERGWTREVERRQRTVAVPGVAR